MTTNRMPRRIHRNKGGRKKGVHYMSEQDYNKAKQKYRDPRDIVVIKDQRCLVVQKMMKKLTGKFEFSSKSMMYEYKISSSYTFFYTKYEKNMKNYFIITSQQKLKKSFTCVNICVV